MDLVPGAVIAGRYRADKRVGAGGMGEVWAGEHLTIGVKVAIKTLLPAASLNHEVIARFKREAYFLGRIRSDHVARVLDFVTDDTYGLVLVMEFVAGESLGSILQRRRLTVEETIDLGVDVVSALSDLHRAKIIHRDLKPGNIILQPLAEGRQRAVVVDFGVSRLVSGGDEEEETITGITKADMALGTLEYMAPEQILNSRDVTPASDLYAVGAMMFRALAGRHVYGNATDSELAHKKLLEDAPGLTTGRADRIAYALEAVVNRALKRKPAQRYKTADEMLSELVPVRDAARVTAIDLDSTTTTDQSLLVDGPSHTAAAAGAAKAPDEPPAADEAKREPGAPAPAQAAAPGQPAAEPSAGASPSSGGKSAAEAAPPPREAVSTSGASRNLSASIPTPPLVKRGVAPGVLAAAALAALSLGAVAGSLLAERRYERAMAAAAEECSARIAAASASAAPEPAAPTATPEATAAASAAPIASATALVAAAAPEAKEIDLGEIEPAASPAKAAPRPRPTAEATAVASAAAAVAGAGTAAEKPTAAASPSAKPSPAATARASSTAAASPEPAAPSKPSSQPGEAKPPSKIIDPFE